MNPVLKLRFQRLTHRIGELEGYIDQLEDRIAQQCEINIDLAERLIEHDYLIRQLHRNQRLLDEQFSNQAKIRVGDPLAAMVHDAAKNVN